ncbi:unnamed protein product [Cochlearia groenlandica]
MAIEAQNINFMSSQLLSNRDCPKFEQNMNYGEFNVGAGEESFAVNTLPYFPPPPSTKRLRESHFCDLNAQNAFLVKRRSIAFDTSPSLLNADFVRQIQNQQQSEIDMFVAQQTQKLKLEIEARQRTQTRMLAFAVQNAISKKLKEKDDEISRVRNANWNLQERVKSLYVENQILRDIAQTNEADANNLRTNLDQVLAQFETFSRNANALAAVKVEDDVESCCGSCVEGGGETVKAVSGGCKRCGEREASVLVLPCRHLCLCAVCCSVLLRNCPVCDSVMNASVHVNMSS